MKRRNLVIGWWLALAVPGLASAQQARNVILFLADAAGIPTLHAASIYAYNEPQKLFVQQMPHIALMETSSASEWVTDSAAGMTAIVTGRKTHNGVISQSASAVRGQKDGERLKTILEYAEERGLATGMVSDSSMISATAAACYAQVNDRRNTEEIIAQLLKPRFGDGVDVMIGPGRKGTLAAAAKAGLDLARALPAMGLPLYKSLEEIPADARRAAVLHDDADYDLTPAVERAIQMLSRNPNGFWLLVETDAHTDRIVKGLERMVAFDRLIRRVAERMKGTNTLILFTADHSFDLRVHDGRKDEPLISEEARRADQPEADTIRWPNVRMDDDHTGEQVLLAAQGPGAERVRGFLDNTDLFHIMLAAYGWKASSGR